MRWVCFALAVVSLVSCVLAVVDHHALFAAIDGAGAVCWFEIGADR